MQMLVKVKKILKKISIRLYFGNSFFRKGVTFGKCAFIREHAKISGGKHIALGCHTRIYPYSRIECFKMVSGDKFNPNIRIGDNVLMGRNTTILCCDEINIGNNCLFASYCFITDENHGFNPALGIRYECQKIETKPVNIGENCWIGEKVIILPGVTIGDNVVIGAGSVVTGNIPSNMIAVGNPAKCIKSYNFVSKKWEPITM